MEKYINIDRDTPMLLPPDLREWIVGNEMVHFVIDAIEGVKINGFRVNHRGTGNAQYPPRMMLALLIYCYANGIFGSRRIERATYRDIAVRYLTGNTHPDHDTIAKFRRENFEVVAECFVKVLELAREMKLLKVGMVSIDGTKLKANASKHKNVGYERAGQLVEQLDTEVRDLLQKAEEADGREEGAEQGLPEELARREKLKSKLQEARERLEERAKARAQAERDEYERKCTKREDRKGSSKGKRIKPPPEEPRPDEQANLVDADSRLMRRSKREGYEEAYNGQAVVDAEGSQLVLAARVTQCASDSNELVADVKMVSKSIGKVAVVLADSAYANGAEVEQLLFVWVSCKRNLVQTLDHEKRLVPRVIDLKQARTTLLACNIDFMATIINRSANGAGLVLPDHAKKYAKKGVMVCIGNEPYRIAWGQSKGL